ncbi:MAG: ABC transporter ATP-binding protein [Rhizobiaceae bacterium]
MLTVDNLTVRYGALLAVDSISLELNAGEVSVLLGSNGAGKSSTLNAISGAIKGSGSIRFQGEEIGAWAPHRIARAGLVQVPEGRHIVGPLTVHENLLLGANFVRSRALVGTRLEEVYALFPRLHERRNNYGGLLSGGEQQMLAFGRALMSGPKVLMLDEPSMGLAPIIIHDIVESINKISALGIAILMVEQNAEVAFSVASTAHVLEQGELVLSGPVADVRTNPLVLRAFLGVEAETGGDVESDEGHRDGV